MQLDDLFGNNENLMEEFGRDDDIDLELEQMLRDGGITGMQEASSKGNSETRLEPKKALTEALFSE